ncbi:MAG: hypothetical protein M3R43_04400 [Acidobacteriota bacterium]|nr:hypothetical protein [Acidobacteriota bacterium]
MNALLQNGRTARSRPQWLRLMAMLCVLLVGGISTAQAAHIHGQWLPQKAARASLAPDASEGQGEEHCPLCVAMHSALPEVLQVAPEPVQESGQRMVAHVLVAPQKLWSFAMFSRPPPVAVRTRRG